MARSLRVAPHYLDNIHLALKRHGYPSQKTFAADVGPSLSTVKKFLKGGPIDYENFRELCDRLELDWQTIVQPNKQQADTQTNHHDNLAPFNTGIPISHPAHFFGRQREITRCFSLLKRKPLQNIAIIGQQRSGKTSLLKHLAQLTTVPASQLRPEQIRPEQKSDWLPNSTDYRWIFVDFHDARFTTRAGLLQYLLSAMNIPVSGADETDDRAYDDLAHFMTLVSEQLTQPTVILLDEIGVGLKRCSELDDAFWESLRSLATHQTQGNLAFILTSCQSPMTLAKETGHSSPFFNIFGYTTVLGPLDELDARSLIASSPLPFPPQDIDWILTQSGGWPFLLQVLCTVRLMALENQDSEAVWQAESWQQLEALQSLIN